MGQSSGKEFSNLLLDAGFADGRGDFFVIGLFSSSHDDEEADFDAGQRLTQRPLALCVFRVSEIEALLRRSSFVIPSRDNLASETIDLSPSENAECSSADYVCLEFLSCFRIVCN